MKKALLLLLLFTLLLSNAVVFAGVHEDVIYELTPNDEEWAKLNTIDEMIEACRISDDTLKKMTTEELLNAVLNFPLIVNLYLYDDEEVGLKELSLQSDAYRELLKREDANKTITAKLINIEKNRTELNVLDELVLKTIYSDKNMGSNLQNYRSNNVVYTPSGSAVDVVIRGEELSSSQITAINNRTISSYPQATFVSGSTTNYNCHSYAWYSTSSNNVNWMDDPCKYMSDGSYSQVSSPLLASRMYYSVGNHSALIYDANSNVLSNATVKSKWGMGPVMIHQASYGPYSSSGLSVWSR